MLFSARATVLMQDLDQILRALDPHVTALADRIGSVQVDQLAAIEAEITAVHRLRDQFQALQAETAQGPEGDFDTRKMRGKIATVPWHVIEHRVMQAARHFGGWRGIEAWIRTAITAKPQPLYPETTGEATVEGALENASDRIFKLIHSFLNPHARDLEARDKGAYADISYPHTDFIKHLNAAYRVALAQRHDRPLRFLDVGCGCGLTVLSATPFFETAEGFDFVPAYVDAGQNLMVLTHQTNGHVFQADGLTFDRYAEYDVIYFYCPMRQSALQHALENRIVSQAKPGTILIAAHNYFDPDRYDCVLIEGQVFLAHGSEDEAATLRCSAERMGPCLPPEPLAFETPWSPILTALSRIGFHGPILL